MFWPLGYENLHKRSSFYFPLKHILLIQMIFIIRSETQTKNISKELIDFTFESSIFYDIMLFFSGYSYLIKRSVYFTILLILIFFTVFSIRLSTCTFEKTLTLIWGYLFCKRPWWYIKFKYMFYFADLFNNITSLKYFDR